MLLRIAYAFAFAAFLAGAALAASSQLRMKAGQWEFTRVVKSSWEAGKPADLDSLAETSARCVRRREGLLAQPKHRVCRFVVKRFSGGLVEALEECAQGNRVATYRYSGKASAESFELVERMTLTEGGNALLETETHFSARWVGPCGA